MNRFLRTFKLKDSFNNIRLSSQALHKLHCHSPLSPSPFHNIPLCVGWQTHHTRLRASFLFLPSYLCCPFRSRFGREPLPTISVNHPLLNAVNSAYQPADTPQTSSQTSILKFAGLHFQIAVNMNGAKVNPLLEIIHSEFFDTALVKSPFTHVNGNKHMVQPEEEKDMIEN